MDEINPPLQESSSSKLSTDPCQLEHEDSNGNSLSIMGLPSEILTKIFEFVPAVELNTSVRLVNHRFKAIAEKTLNLKFGKLNRKLSSLINQTYSAVRETRDDMEIICLCKLLNMAEILRAENNLITATIWRHALNHFDSSIKSCMYAGLILDKQEQFIRTLEEKPYELYSHPIILQQVQPKQLKKIIALNQNFCMHFDQLIGHSSKKTKILSGCKMIDILDTIVLANKTIHYEIETVTTFKAKYTYYLKHSWFVPLPVMARSTVANSRRKQSATHYHLMNMHLQRIARAHNDMYMNDSHCIRENILRTKRVYSIHPKSNSFQQNGEIGKVSFYYGVMNATAYNLSFSVFDQMIEGREDGDYIFTLRDRREPEISENEEDTDEEGLGLKIEVVVEVPLSYAPRQYLLERMTEERQISLTNQHRRKGRSDIQITFDCEGSSFVRLPRAFSFEFHNN